MVRRGKEPADADAPPDQHVAPETVQDTRWLNGINRQLRPDAAEQRLAASQAAAVKRKAEAMPDDERKKRDAERNRKNRARKAAEKASAAAAAREAVAAQEAEEAGAVSTLDAVPPVPTLETFNGWCVQYYGAPIDEDEWDAFADFGVFSELRREEDCSDQALIELFFIWRNSDEYEQYQIDRQPIDYAREPSPPPVHPPPEPSHAPQLAFTLLAVDELPLSSLPLWPQPTWQNVPCDERAPTFRMVFTDGDATVTHAGKWHGGGPGRSLAGGDVDVSSVVSEGVHEFAFVLERTHTGSKSPMLGLRGTRIGHRGQPVEWRMSIDLTDGRLHFDAIALYDEPDLSRWPGGVYIGFGQRIECDTEAGAPAKPVKLERPMSTPLHVNVRIDFTERSIAFMLGRQAFEQAPMPVLDACCSLFGACPFQPTSAQPFITFADTRVPCQNQGRQPYVCHPYWCECNVISSAEGTAVTLCRHVGAPPPPPPLPPPPPPADPDPDPDYPWADGGFAGLSLPRSRSPDGWTPSFTWDEFLDREYARAAGELGWWGTNWGDAARPREKSKWEQQAEERHVRTKRERAAGQPPYREQPRYGPRGDTAGDLLFRKERAEWYEKFTGRLIADTCLQEQNELCDAIARRFRTYTDGRGARCSM